jgi:hypothetical protein
MHFLNPHLCPRNGHGLVPVGPRLRYLPPHAVPSAAAIFSGAPKQTCVCGGGQLTRGCTCVSDSRPRGQSRTLPAAHTPLFKYLPGTRYPNLSTWRDGVGIAALGRQQGLWDLWIRGKLDPWARCTRNFMRCTWRRGHLQKLITQFAETYFSRAAHIEARLRTQLSHNSRLSFLGDALSL